MATMAMVVFVDGGHCQRARARAMRARMAVIVVISGGKDAIVAAAINRRHS
jgi:hypothetical protein